MTTVLAYPDHELDAPPDPPALAVTVTRGCGTVEVRVSGPGATLRLFFDPWELPPGDGRCVVGRAIARYRSSLLGKDARLAPRGAVKA
jgi:hypothetical protein